ncbi:hypothetical protein GCM10023201_41470 [Actinomycetospora corticicola]|uniref:Transcriptional regulator with XRE-family HTH domain n=1 Tax=Actinomycetospora corticicola TaxID=663602 RepID=A0A7Y9DWL0_9PSEU|nr:helix-turn-helix transcriptional regulator [Actinomycetospora corticicola]NYD36765.1 transcriptional regulator with XRE-family HTH domain [Actinomycetospora corticicola]
MTSAAVDEGTLPRGLFTKWVAGEFRAQLGRTGMSQRGLARALGVTPPWVNERLSGRHAMSTDDMERIAGVLNTTPLDVLTGQTRPPGPIPPAPSATEADESSTHR